MLDTATVPDEVYVELRCPSCRDHARWQAPVLAVVTRGMWDEPVRTRDLTVFTRRRGRVRPDNPDEHLVHRLGGSGEMWRVATPTRGVQWVEAGGLGDRHSGYPPQVELSCPACTFQTTRNTRKLLRQAVAAARRGERVRYPN